MFRMAHNKKGRWKPLVDALIDFSVLPLFYLSMLLGYKSRTLPRVTRFVKLRSRKRIGKRPEELTGGRHIARNEEKRRRRDQKK